jgi:hypothetical protein
MNNEPVAWIYKRNDGVKFLNWKTWKDCETCNGEFIPLYTAPQGDGCGNCHACLVGVIENHMPVTSQRMIVCSDCGNKRCPKASNHRHKCTGSNEVGQYGSIYTAPREWQYLTDDEIKEIIGGYGDEGSIGAYTRMLIDKLEAKIKEKNVQKT